MNQASRLFLLLALGAAVVAALVLLPGLSGDFVFDDRVNIQHNTALHVDTLDQDSLETAIYSFAPGGGSRILAELTFALDYWRGGGLDPRTFKSTNIVIHALTTFVLVLFLRLLLQAAGWAQKRAMYAALLMALTWAVHPLLVSSVLYVVQRMQTLGTLFLVCALWAYLKMRLAQIEGSRSRQFGVLVGLFWVLALASKEDSAMFPAYTLLLELTVLRFRAAQAALAHGLRKGYLVLTVIGALAYLLLVVPHYWSWGAYPGRDFSSYERLLTQGRVLVTYLGQICWPLPSRMPFYYDDLAISRSLLQPATTLPALLLIAGLLAIAWRLRQRLPLFALGVLLFFAGHFITSNVLGLELAFEHRNHFPLIGAVLAIGALLAAAAQRLGLSTPVTISICILLVASLATASLLRARVWGNPITLAQKLTEISPNSERAWNDLCTIYFTMSKSQADSTYLDKAIAACERGGEIPGSAVALSNVIIFKTIKGDVSRADWDAYLERLRHVAMNAGNKNSIWVLINNANPDLQMDNQGMLDAIDIVARRAGFSMFDYTRIAYIILEKTDQPDEAYQYFDMAVRASDPNSPFILDLLADLRAQGRHQWADNLEKVALEQSEQAATGR